VHLHACATGGLFRPGPEGVAFLPARPVTPTDLATLTERVRTRLVRWFLRKRLLDAEAAAAMLAWENGGFSIDASVRIAVWSSRILVNRSSHRRSRRHEGRRPGGTSSCRGITIVTQSKRRPKTCR
jgi:hypothetical protein